MARGTHFCALPGSFEEQFAIAVPFLRAGVEAREKCLYVAHDNSIEVVQEELTRRGLAAPSVMVVPSEKTPLRADTLDARALLATWRVATEEAVGEGFTGLRVVVEMTWALAARVDALAAYEEAAKVLFDTMPLHALCQYNRARFPRAVLQRAATATHPALLLEDGRVAAGSPSDYCTVMGWHE